MSRAFGAVLFDLDGTLTPVRSVWQHLHERLGLWEGGAESHQEDYRSGRIDYATFCALDALHWKGKRVADLRRITDAIPYRAGVMELLARLRSSGLLVGVISTGLTLLAERIHAELDLAFTIANRLETRHGRLTGTVKVNVEDGRKDDAVALFCSRFGLSPESVISVGDSGGDISMFRSTGFSIAFNPVDAQTAAAATLVHEGERLDDLWPRLPPLDGAGTQKEKA